MKKASFIIFAMIFGSMMLISTSCVKNEGCTDPDSVNYDADAEDDDGSCMYEGDVVFWYGEDAAIGLLNDAALTLTFYVDGNIIGSTATSIFWLGAPDCGDNASLTVTKSLGGNKTKTFSFSAVDQTGWEYWSGMQTFTANQCTKVELVWNTKNAK